MSNIVYGTWILVCTHLSMSDQYNAHNSTRYISYLPSTLFHIVLSIFLFPKKMLEWNVNSDDFINSEMF